MTVKTHACFLFSYVTHKLKVIYFSPRTEIPFLKAIYLVTLNVLSKFDCYKRNTNVTNIYKVYKVREKKLCVYNAVFFLDLIGRIQSLLTFSIFSMI